MSNLHQVIEYKWPQKDAWPALQHHIEMEIKKKHFTPVDERPAQVTATFSMRANECMWHTDDPTIETLAEKLIYCLHSSGMVDARDVVQLNIGKVVPGPNAPDPRPGVRISIMVVALWRP